MRHTLLIWICFAVVLFQPGSFEEDGSVQDVEEEEEDPYSAHMPQLMNILNHYSGKMYSNVHNVHAVLNKRSVDPDIDADISEEADDPYGQHVHQLMAILHRVYNDKAANLHAQIHKRSDDPEDRSLNTEDDEKEDEDANFLPQLVKDLHQIYNGKSDSFRTEINRRFASHETHPKIRENQEINMDNNVFNAEKH